MYTEKEPTEFAPEIAVDGINMSIKTIKIAAEIHVTPIQVFGRLTGEVTPEATSPLQICPMKTTPAGQSTGNYQIYADSASPGVKLPSSEGKSHFETSVVLGLTCNNPRNKLWSTIRHHHQLRKPTEMILMDKKEQLLDNAAHDGPGKNCVNGKMIPAKRKRGRPIGCKNKSRAVNLPGGEWMKVASSHSLNSLRAKHPLESIGGGYKACFEDFRRIGIRSKRGRKMRPTMDIIAATQVQSPSRAILEGAMTSIVTTDAETGQEGIVVPVSYDDKPRSTWYNEKYSPVAIGYTKSSPVSHASNNDEVVEEERVPGPVNHQLMKQTTLMTNDLCSFTKEKEKENDEDVENDQLLGPVSSHQLMKQITLMTSDLCPETKEKENDEVVVEDQVLGPVNHLLMKQTTIMTSDLCPSTQEKENEIIDTGTNFLPFLKSSPLWKLIECMPIFKQLPQNPHFNPLYDCKELCREGLAIGNMVTFAGLAEKISKFQLGESETILDSSMVALLDLETQGFDIEPMRMRLDSLLLIKGRHARCLRQIKEVENVVFEQRKVKEKLDAELIQIDLEIAKLRVEREVVLLASQRKESEKVGLTSNMERWRKSMESDCSEFERVASAPWL